MSRWLNGFLAAHEPWQRAAWTAIEVALAAVPVATLRMPAPLVPVVAALVAFGKSAAAKAMVAPPVNPASKATSP